MMDLRRYVLMDQVDDEGSWAMAVRIRLGDDERVWIKLRRLSECECGTGRSATTEWRRIRKDHGSRGGSNLQEILGSMRGCAEISRSGCSR